MSAYRDDLLTRLAELTGAIDVDSGSAGRFESTEGILSLFEEMQADCDRLADELFLCYEQLNITFAATAQMGRCKSTQDALRVLNEITSGAVASSFSYYIGELDYRLLLPDDGSRDHENMTAFAPDADVACAEEFFARNEQSLRALTQIEREGKVVTIDRRRPADYDSAGRGNVLAVRLENTEKDIGYLGTLIFVRTEEQDLFTALHVSLGTSLMRMGAALLGNIIYAEKLQRTSLQTVNSLVRAMEAKDAYTSGHSSRVAETALILGRKLGLSRQELEMLEWAGLLHDVGKIGIGDAVLSKPGKLTAEEFDHIKTHPTQSEQVLQPVDGLRSVLPIVRHHHEHYDGSGYPDGLIGEEIPSLARIIQVADIWDALTSSRSYRQAVPFEKALRIMQKEAGTVTDAKVAQTLIDVVRQDGSPQHDES